MKPRLKNALEALKAAYNNGNLKANHCTKCAVGTIIAASDLCGGTGSEWYAVILEETRYTPTTGLNQIKSTGYTPKQIISIERTFESSAKRVNDRGETTRYTTQKGLIAVIKELCKIERIPAAERNQIIKDFGL